MSPNAGRRPVTACRDRQRGDSGADERPLLVERQREGEVERAARRSRRAAARRPSASAIRATAVATRLAFGERGRSPPISMLRRAGAGDRVEVDHGDDVTPVGRVRQEASRAEAAERAAVGGEEHDPAWDRTRAASSVWGCAYARASSISAAVPLALSFAPGPGADVVPVRHDDDRVGHVGGPGATAAMLCSRTRPSPATCSSQDDERIFEAVDRAGSWFSNQPTAPTDPALPGRAVRVLRREIPGEGQRRVGVEGSRQRRLRERKRLLDREREQQQRQRDDEQRGAVEAAVRRAARVSRAGAGGAAAGAGGTAIRGL